MNRRLVRAAVVLGAALAVAGCQSVADRRASDEALCRSYGFRTGSDGFANCLQNIDLDRSADRRAVFNGPYGGFGLGVGYRRGPWW